VDEAALALRLAPAVERLGTDSGPWGELAHAAQKLVGNEDPDTLELALEHADEARRADPRLSAAWALKGNLHALLDSRNEALTALDRALSLQPNKANWLAARGILHARASRLDRALEDAERALRLDGLHSDALKLRARLRMLDGDTNGAIQDLQRVTEDSPKDEHALLDLAQVYSLTDRFEEASASLTRAETLAPTLIDVWQTRVRLELERLSLDAALESLRRGIDKVASDEDRQRLHTRYVAMAYFGKRQRSLRLYSTERLAKDPNDRWGLCAEAEFTALNKDYKRAADLFGRCADKHPNYPEARIQQFRILYLLKDKGESDPDLEPRLRRFLDEHSEDPVVLCYAVHYYASIGNDVSRAQAKARRATEVAPTFGLAWRTRALISGILKERRDGLEFARRACALDPDDYEAFRIAGSLLAEADDMPGALKAWLSSLAAFPLQDNVAEHVMLALVKSKKSSVAIEFAKKRYALARVTTKPPTLGFEIHFLNALVNLKRWGEAATTLTKIQTRELTHPADACGLALALAKMGRRKEAKALLEGVLQKAPGHPQAERLLAQIESGRGL
jgi:tetratricopeptide (TPR) repeat protein